MVARNARIAIWKPDLNEVDKEGSACIAVVRNSLKSELMHTRGELTTSGWLPICPICGEPVQTPDMHEAILTRGDIKGLPVSQQVKIFVRENCVLVHPGRCHIQAATKEGTHQCVLQLLEKEGLIAIMHWLTGMESILPQELINEAIGLVQLVNQQSMMQVQVSEVRSISPIVGEVGPRPNAVLPGAAKGEIAGQPRRGVIYP